MLTCADGIRRNALRPLTHEEFVQRFWNRVDVRGPNECWVWLGSVCGSKSIYGNVAYHGRLQKSHRVAYELMHGLIPKGMCACHHCDNRLCCNPSHIFIGTQKDNVRDMMQKGRDGHGVLRGEESPVSKYTSRQAMQVKRLRLKGVSQKQIAVRTGVSKTAVGAICQGRVWRHVGDPAWTYPLMPPTRLTTLS